MVLTDILWDSKIQYNIQQQFIPRLREKLFPCKPKNLYNNWKAWQTTASLAINYLAH